MGPAEFVDFFRDLPTWVKVPAEIIALSMPWFAHELHKAQELCNRLTQSTKRESIEKDSTASD